MQIEHQGPPFCRALTLGAEIERHYGICLQYRRQVPAKRVGIGERSKGGQFLLSKNLVGTAPRLPYRFLVLFQFGDTETGTRQRCPFRSLQYRGEIGIGELSVLSWRNKAQCQKQEKGNESIFHAHCNFSATKIDIYFQKACHLRRLCLESK